MTAIPTYSHLELHALRERVSSRLREFGVRTQLPKLELPKLAALAELIEAGVQQSDTLGRRFLKNLLLGLMLLLEACVAEFKPDKQLDFTSAQTKQPKKLPQSSRAGQRHFCGASRAAAVVLFSQLAALPKRQRQ